MSATTPSEELKDAVGDVPIHTSVRVLGAKIRVDQLQERCEMYGVQYPLGRSRETVEVEAVGGDTEMWHRDRKYIAAWARRTLFRSIDTDTDRSAEGRR